MDRPSDKSHISAVCVASRGNKSFLRDDDVMTHVYVILVVEPHAFTDPRLVANVKFPWKSNPGSWPEDNSLTDLGAKDTENQNSQSRANLPRICDEDQLGNRPYVYDCSRTIPR